MYLGIDAGTSSVKAVLLDAAGRVVGQASSSLEVSRPNPLWSEQDPEEWWRATCSGVQALRASHPAETAEIAGIGLSGQMHGATLLDDRGGCIRPAILWNDGRSEQECRDLEKAEPDSRAITGNIAMPGFTAPKLLWVKKHEPENFRRIAKVLLPKDYLRYRMTGDFASDVSDSAGTLWLDVAQRDWSERMLAATALSEAHMPTLYEGTEATGTLRRTVAEEWGMKEVPVAAGGGDNAAGAVGIGVVTRGNGFVSLGTSGVYFIAEDGFRPNADRAIHTFCHCVPDTWHKMAVILSAASCLTWVTRAVGAAKEQDVLDRLASRQPSTAIHSKPYFLPYLSGERTPHNDPMAAGVFFGMSHETDSLDLVEAVLEGVAFAFSDGQEGLLASGTSVEQVSVIGGGARSRFWVQMIADVLERPLTMRAEGEVGPAVGAARLARLAVTGEKVEDVCSAPPVTAVAEPDSNRSAYYRERLQTYRGLYSDLRQRFRER